MKEYISAIVIGLWAVVCLANAAELARTPNFSVIGPNAQDIADRAESCRAAFLQEWLGRDSPQADVRTVISFKPSASENSGYTLARDNAQQKFHNVFLTGDGSTLNHEVAHTVLATAFPGRLAPWVEEGIASRYDRGELLRFRVGERAQWMRNGFPQLADVMVDSDVNYAAAESLVDYLLTIGDREQLLNFAELARHCTWDAALREIYNIRSVGQLQRDWQSWVAGTNHQLTN